MSGKSKTSQQCAEVLWRLYLANVANLYTRELAARKKVKKRRVKTSVCMQDDASPPRKSVKDIFIDLLLPELMTENVKGRTQAKTKFNRWIQHGKRWAKLIRRYGSGILLLIPPDLTNNM